LRAFPNHPLTRDFTTETFQPRLRMNGQRDKWHWSSTGNAELRSTTHTDRGFDLGNIQARIDAGEPLDPLGTFVRLMNPRDRSRSTRHSLGFDGTANGPLFALPAGDATATFRIGLARPGSTVRPRPGITGADLHRNSGVARSIWICRSPSAAPRSAASPPTPTRR
jgi:hypothetical protein